MTLRMTRPRLDLLVLLHRYGGEACNSEGRLRVQLAADLGYENAPATLRRVLRDLESSGLLTTSAESGKLYRVLLTEAGLDILQERGLVPTGPRRYLIDPGHFKDRGHINAQIASAITHLERYGRRGDIPDDVDRARLEANYALHADLTPACPDPETLALEIARTRSILTALADAYLIDVGGLDSESIDAALMQLQELRLTLIAARFAVDHPFPDL